VLFLGALFLFSWTRIHALGDARHALAPFCGWFAMAFTIYLAMLWVAPRIERPRVRLPLGLILAVAALSRWVLLDTTPTLSDDIHRYRWDGRVQLARIDPYAFPPDHPALAFLRDDGFGSITFPHLRTVYPFLTQLAFRLGVAWGDTWASLKLVFVLAELVTCLALLLLLIHLKRSPLWVVAYAWHPLAILEIAGSGHNDALGIALLWAGLAAWHWRGWIWATIAWVAVFLSKFVSLIVLPWWAFRRPFRGWIGVFVLLAGLPLVLHPTSVTALVTSLSAMSGRTTANGFLYVALSTISDAKIASAIIGMLGLALLIWWAKREDDLMRYLFGGLIIAAILAPTLHPWYLLWLLPFLCFWRIPALLALSGTAVLTYAAWPGYLAGGAWAMPTWARVAEYAPVLVLALWELRRLAS
jgi:hypothetical protein